jgi:hypothetical protein
VSTEAVAAITHRDSIPPVACGISRPVWSVMIPTYHCAAHLREALDSVLSQDPGPDLMQIEVVDDHSTRDDPEAVVAELGRGRVAFFRQPENVGHVRNFNTCLQRSRGRLVHLLHGDDMVRDGFYRTLQARFEAHPEIGAAFCRYIAIDESGRWRSISPLETETSCIVPNWLEKIATGQRLQPPAMVVRRAVYEQIGGFDDRICSYGEDWEMWVRIAASYPVWHEVEPLALYRVGQTSLSRRTLQTGENMRDLHRVVEINRAVLPPERADAISKAAERSHALAAIRRARRMLEACNSQGMSAQLREALRTSRNTIVLIQAVRLIGFWFARVLASRVRSMTNRNDVLTTRCHGAARKDLGE